MNAQVDDLMVSQVITATPSQTVEHVRDIMHRNKINSLPVVNPEGEPVGIVSAADLLGNGTDGAPVSTIMTERVYTIQQYSSPHIAARMMRNHKIHHLVVTHEQRIVGIISSFDLLRLVEEHRYVTKPPPTETKKHTGERGKTESPGE